MLCVASRGVLDEAACAMLVAGAGRSGAGGAAWPRRESVSRAAIDGLDVAGVTEVCVSWLEVSGSLSGLRYLARRLRQRAPGLPLLIGVWGAELAADDAERLRGATGADAVAVTLAGMAEACRTRTAPAAARPEAA